jgi:hypothetical protein
VQRVTEHDLLEAEPVKTLVGLGQPLDAPTGLGFFEETLPDSGVRKADEADEGDGFSEHEADTRVELMPPEVELMPPESEPLDSADPLPEMGGLGEPFREAALLPANWDDDEATRPQVFLPNHPSEPPPTLPGSRLADSDVNAAPLPSSPLASESESERRASGLDPRLSGMLAGAGIGAATAIALVALFAWRSSPPAGSAPVIEALPGPALPVNELPPAAEARAPAADAPQKLPDVNADELSQPVMSSTQHDAALSRERRMPGAESSAVAALPVKLEDEAPASGPLGMLSVTSLPPAHVVLDGRPIGMTPKLLPVAAGDHSVLFVHPELGRRLLSVSVESGAKSEALNRF